MSRALNGSGRDIWLNFHCWNQPPGDERCAEFGNSFRVYDDHQDSWDSTVRVISFMQRRQPWWGADPARGWPDMDFVFTGGEGCASRPPSSRGAEAAAARRCPGQSEDEYLSEFSLWAVAGGQIVLATDPRNMSDFQRKVLLNKDVLTVFKDTSHFGEVAMVGSGSPAIDVRPAADDCSVTLLAEPPSGTGQVPARRDWGWPHTRGTCTLGQSYGCVSHADGSSSVWVSNDCGGRFRCGGAQADIFCESFSGQNVSCPCITTQVWARPLRGGAAAVALFNPSNRTQTARFEFRTVPSRSWSGATALTITDLWSGHSTTATGAFAAHAVPAHGTVLLWVSSGGG